MHYRVIFRLEKIELIDKFHSKLKNCRDYMSEEGHQLETEVVCAGPVVNHFMHDYSDFIDVQLDVALCNNALKAANMEPLFDRNIRTVKAGIGELVEKKAAGWIEVTIE